MDLVVISIVILCIVSAILYQGISLQLSCSFPADTFIPDPS